MSNYLEKAITTLRSLGIRLQPQESPVLSILERIAKYDLQRVTAIAATLQQSSAFNAAIRENLEGMDVSSRYANIVDGFNSIVEDARQVAAWMEDGRLDLKERAQLQWMKLRRGSIPERFGSIRDAYLEVAGATSRQLETETRILDAYQDFRMALKSAEVDAQQVLAQASAALQQRKAALEAAGAELGKVAEDDGVRRSALELARDEALRAVQEEDKSYQVAKDLADDLKTAFNTAELVFARLQQTQAVKERLYQRSVSFFATNETVFSGLTASFTSMSGLNETTQTFEAMKDGMNKGLEALAGDNRDSLQEALRAGYGATLKSTSVKTLADAIVDYQASSLKLIEELRRESSEAARDIEQATESGKQRFAALLQQGV
ncbi:merozoite surface protein 3b [Pseudomonas citronellolis]|uniref:merozoite surface protein 3b n=1 Tax=Pseudomonas citronellolis TaxID=53408 RepID=UPI002112F190|nr:merozoite surface protein 3b [Pseudomonas citronellolis]UUC50622.1 merozoite surface protein 3b [Pseudomonas citronellolis]